MAAGLTMVVTVGLLAYGGIWLDGRLGTQPLFVILGALLGVLGGTIHLIASVAPEMLPFRRRAKAPAGDATRRGSTQASDETPMTGSDSPRGQVRPRDDDTAS